MFPGFFGTFPRGTLLTGAEGAGGNPRKKSLLKKRFPKGSFTRPISKCIFLCIYASFLLSSSSENARECEVGVCAFSEAEEN